jgi:hypothetical protein
MSRVAIVLSFERVVDDGGQGVDVKVDPGGDSITVPHFADPGDDSCPLPGDTAALGESSGAGAEHATGYADTRNAGKALAGEKRLYARAADGTVKVELWLKRDGSIVISNGQGSFAMETGGNVTINGVTIDTGGNVRAGGEVTAKVGPQQVSLSTHSHLSGTGPTQPPTPGT